MNLIDYLLSLVGIERNLPGFEKLPDKVSKPDGHFKRKHKQRFTWVLDPGHGKLTTGKRSPVLPDGRQLLEYEFNGDVVSRIAKKLSSIGVDYYITLDKDAQSRLGNYLQGRVDIANKYKSKHEKIFVSVHANAGPVKNPKKDFSSLFRGIEVFYFSSSSFGKKVAEVFQKNLVDNTKLKDRGIKPTSSFFVLKHTNMPSILTENGFFNNPDEVLLLLSSAYREKVADAHVSAILEIEKKYI